MRNRRGPIHIAVLLMLSAMLAVGSLPALAADAEDDRQVQVSIAPVGADGVGGLAILAPVDPGTAVQVLVVAAPVGTTAMVHPGRCDGIDPMLVALLGDVGAGAAVQTTIPTAFDTLTDGGHVIVLHPGVDLTTVLGCGPIPGSGAAPDPRDDVIEVEPDALPTPVRPPGPDDVDVPGPDVLPTAVPVAPTLTPVEPAGDRYEDTRHGYSVEWGEPWQHAVQQTQDGLEYVVLFDGPTSVTFIGWQPQSGGDAAACVDGFGQYELSLQEAGELRELAVALGPDGRAISSSDAGRARQGYAYVQEVDGEATRFIDVIECQRLSDTAVVQAVLVTPAEQIAVRLPAFDALLGMLTVSSDARDADPRATPNAIATPPPPPATLAPQPDPTPAPQVDPIPTPGSIFDPTPPPQVDPACAGIEAWLGVADAEIDRVNEILADLRTLGQRGDTTAYSGALATFEGELSVIIGRLEDGITPGPMSDANRLLVEAFRGMARASNDMYIVITGSFDLNDFNRAVSDFEDASDVLGDAQREMGRIAGICRITR